jgi:3-isopropylmalate dehydrogenase
MQDEQLKKKVKDPQNSAMSIRLFTRVGCHRIVKAAFEYAKENGRKKVTAVHKANVVRATDGMFLEEAKKVASEYPDIEYEEENVDAVAMWLIKRPESYDVLVTTNMFGDILSDEAAQLIGGMGFSASGNIGESYALFEPSHGSAPKYAGQYKVNPTAMCLSVKMLLDWLGESEKAKKLERAIAAVLKENQTVTYDLGGKASTLDMAKAFADRIK